MLTLAFLLSTLSSQEMHIAREPALRVVTYNIRYGTANDGENRWENRREWLFETIRDQAPDVLGLQEALAFQRDEILEAVPGYTAVGVGREGGDRGELSPLLIADARLEIEDSGTFWLSPTPEVIGSKGWDAALPRIATWAKLKDRATGQQLLAINTHFDHRGAEARRQAAIQIAAWAERFGEMPRVVLGDLNAGESAPPLEAFREAGWRDSYRVRHPEQSRVGTFTGFRARFRGAKIDYVLCDDHWDVRRSWIDRTQKDGRTPSDHCAVGADLVMRGNAREMPVLAGDWRALAANPDLGELQGERQEVVDHGLWQADDGSWQLWACIRGTKVGRVLYRWEGPSLKGELQPVGIAMRAEAQYGESIDDWNGQEWIQAPFAWKDDHGWHMLYGGHRTEQESCQICLATSKDGREFERHAGEANRSRVFVGPGEARDPMVIRIGDRFLCYYTGHDEGERAPCKIYCRSSDDLVTWSEPVAVCWGGSAGSGNWSAECPFVVARGGWFYLFRTSSYGEPVTHVYRSADPLDFGRGDDSKKIGTIAVAAPEVVQDGERTWITSVHDLRGGIQSAPLEWRAEEEVPGTAAFVEAGEVLFDFEDGSLEGWEVIGEAFDGQPTFAEGPMVRGRLVAPSGHYFIGGYEKRPGPEAPAGETVGDAPVGELVSPPFELTGTTLTFLLGGGQDREKLYLVLETVDGEELLRATGGGTNRMARIAWDVSKWTGQSVRLRLVDHSSDSWGHLNLDDVRIR